MANSRFVNNSLSKLQESNYNPSSDYEGLPVLTLEEAVENITPLLPDVMDYVATAKTKCTWQSTLLTQDESAAIYLYTMSGKPFFSSLNTAFRATNRQVLKPWFAFLKLLITAFEKLPSIKAIIWRGVQYDETLDFVENSVFTWWSINSCSMNINSVQPFLGENGTLYAIEAVDGKDISMFSAIPDEQEVILMPGTRVRAKYQSLNLIDRFFIIHVEQINRQSESQSESNVLFEQIKEEYQRNSRIKRFMNSSLSYPIELSYINLAIVQAKEQHEKEKQLRDTQHALTIMNAYEEIYGMKTAIDVKNIFETCKNDKKQVLVFGPAGIGKSTFCQYIAYKWATGSYWAHYELLALIPLRCLTVDRYPPNKDYSLVDLVKRELFSFDLTGKEEELLKKQFDPKKILWILDGYDEIIPNVPSHLQSLFKQLLKTPHHIITSRPYLNTLSYDVQMQITGFTDENIEIYVQNFFDQMKDQLDNALLKGEALLSFLRSNPSIWGVAHIPINLELICSLWSNEDWSETEQLTMTTLYTKMTKWLFRRYLSKQDNQMPQLTQDEIEQCSQKELAFLESLAFNAMNSNTIIIRPALLQKTLSETKISSKQHPHILNIGILKSFHQQGIGSCINMEKDHYFVHLSFQEYFAARYLINALKEPKNENAIDFIKHEKYNQRYILVFNFAAGLVSEGDGKSSFQIFWSCILGEPLDLVGIRHMQLVISLMEETTDKSTLPQHSHLFECITSCIKHSFTAEGNIIGTHLAQSLQTAQSVTCDQTITNVLIDLLEHNDLQTKAEVLLFIAALKISHPPIALITSVTAKLDDKNEKVKAYACQALGSIGEKAAMNDVIDKLVNALGNQIGYVRFNACKALGKIAEKAGISKVISKLVNALGDQSDYVRGCACKALGMIGEKAATNEVISKLVNALGDQSINVRKYASGALGNIGEKAATNEVISTLVNAVEDQSDEVRLYACKALGNLGEKAATNEVISKLVNALGDQSDHIRQYACIVLGSIGEKAAANEVISKLVNALGDQTASVRLYACIALGKIGQKAATNEVISKLVNALGDHSYDVRQYACEALGNLGEKAATNEVLSKLVNALGDQSDDVRQYACKALGSIGEKAAMTEVLSKLVNALEDQSILVRLSAREALGKIGEKAVTNEVISKLVNALGDHSYDVRQYACEALGNLGEKAATTEVITKLANALGDESVNVRKYASEALGKIGEKAATNEVISKIIAIENSYGSMISYVARDAVANILCSSAVITQLDPNIITDLCLRNDGSKYLKNVSDNDLVKFFLHTKNSDWLSFVTRLTLLKGSAVVVMKDKLVIYGMKERSDVLFPRSEIPHDLIGAFMHQRKRLQLYFELPELRQ